MIRAIFSSSKIRPPRRLKLSSPAWRDRASRIIPRTIPDRGNFSGSFARLVIRTVIGRNERSGVPDNGSGFSVRGKHLLLSARCAPLARQFFKAPSSSLSSRLHLTI